MTNKEKIAQMKEMQNTIIKLQGDIEAKKLEYKRTLKEWLGITDGEQASVLDLAEAVLRLKDSE